MQAEFDALSRYAIPGHPAGVFGIGLGARRGTFQSQQLRGFNLPYLLETSSKVSGGKKVAVIGASFAGIAAATGFCLRDCDVTIIEAQDYAFPLFTGNTQRPIHPNLFKWPSPESKVMMTDLPACNWQYGTPNEVIKQIMGPWPCTNEPRCIYGMRVERLLKGVKDQIHLTAKKSGKREGKSAFEDMFDIVVIATGFGREAEVTGIESPRYWALDDLDQDLNSAATVKQYLVSGTGDGAIIDLVRVATRSFDLNALCAPRSILMDGDFMAEIARIEEAAPSTKLEASAYFDAAYENLGLPKELARTLRNRSQVVATLNVGLDGVLWNPNAQSINRILLHALNHLGRFDLILGDLVSGERMANGNTKVCFNTENGHEFYEFNKAIVRHGPVHNAGGLAKPTSIAKMRELQGAAHDPTLSPMWDKHYYSRKKLRSTKPLWTTTKGQRLPEVKAALWSISDAEMLANETSRAVEGYKNLKRRLG